MGIYDNSSWSRNPISVVTITVSLFLMLAHNVTSFQFPPASFGNTNGIAFHGDAFVSNGTLHLTKIVNGAPLPNSAGRAFYAQPVRLWDAKTGELAGFTTTFSFVVAPAPYVPGPMKPRCINLMACPTQVAYPHTLDTRMIRVRCVVLRVPFKKYYFLARTPVKHN